MTIHSLLASEAVQHFVPHVQMATMPPGSLAVASMPLFYRSDDTLIAASDVGFLLRIHRGSSQYSDDPDPASATMTPKM